MSGKSPIEAVDRALRVLEHLAQVGPSGISLAELSQRVELNKATVHRVLAALRFRDFVSQLSSGAYVLGPAATLLAPQFYREENLPELLRPALAALSEAVGELRSEERRVGKGGGGGWRGCEAERKTRR